MKKGITFFIFLIFFTSPTAFGLTVEKVHCLRLKATATCEIALNGIVSDHDVLFMAGISDIDITSAYDKQIGSTGHIFGKEFYAQFIPRIYPLFSISGSKNPVIFVHTKSVFSDAVGISNNSDVKIASLPEALFLGLLSLAQPLGLALLALVLAVLSINPLRHQIEDGWIWSKVAVIMFVPSTTFFIFSMSKVPRLVIPSLIDAKTYYLLHALIEGTALWAATHLIANLKFPTIPLAKLEDHSTKIQETHFDRRLFSNASSWSALIALALLLSFEKFGLKQAHSYSVALQTACLGLVAFSKAKNFSWRTQTQRSLRGSLILFMILLVSSVALIRDSIVYLFAHKPGTNYFIQWVFVATIAAIWYRSKEFLSCQVKSLRLTNEFRKALGNEPIQQEVGRRICEQIQKIGDFARVSILSVKGAEGFLAESVGPEALPPDTSPRPHGYLMQLAIAQRPILHMTHRDLSTLSARVGLYERSMLTLIIIRGDEVQAAIAIMARSGKILRPQLVKVLELAASAIGLEVLAYLDALVAAQSKSHLESMVRCTSGIVFETQDAWGRLIPSPKPTKRIVVSADGLKTTHVSERAANSALLMQGIAAYKQDLYAVWFGLLERFEFLSKDVRGDDFWAVSPLKFKNPYLTQIGAAKAGVFLAHLLEVHARKISLRPEYHALGFVGAHVAIGSAELRILVLGTQNRQCVDVDSPYMARLHRVRSIANPGHILVDLADIELGKVVTELAPTGMHHISEFTRGLADLSSLLHVARLRTCVLPSEIKALESEAVALAASCLPVLGRPNMVINSAA